MRDRSIERSEIEGNYGVLKNYIAGKWVDSKSSETRDVINPATNEILAQVPLSPPSEVEQAIEVARDAFETWKMTPLARRTEYFFKLKHLMEEHFEELSVTIVKEMGKTIQEAKGELRRAIEEVDCVCGIPSLMKGYSWEDVSPGVDLQVVLVPMGVFFMVPSYNFPAMVPLEYMPYAVACGNTYIVKPSSEVPITQAKIFELIEKAGFPPGVVNMLHGSREVVDNLIENPDTKGFSFVGSTPVGKYLYEKAAKHAKRAQCACGAKNHVVVMPDAHLDLAVNAMMTSFFGCAGQRCLAGAVAVPVGDVYKPFKEKFVELASKLRVGYGLDENVQMGPMVSKKQMANVLEFIDKGVKEGGKLLLDGRNIKVDGYPNGAFIGPTIFDEVTPDMVIAKEEIFGPVACIIPARDLDGALELIEHNRYGHSGLIFTASGRVAREFQQRVPCGNVGINMGLAATQAFATLGGFRDSCYGDLHGRSESVLFFTDRKIVVSRWF